MVSIPWDDTNNRLQYTMTSPNILKKVLSVDLKLRFTTEGTFMP